MFDEMNKHIKEDTVRYLFNITIETPVERKAVVDVENLSSPSDGTLPTSKTVKKMKRLEEMTYALVEVVKNIKTVVEDNLGGLNVKVTRV